jgi:hypothetical protein
VTTQTTPVTRKPLHVVEAVRAFAVTFGGPVLLALAAMASISFAAAALVRGDAPSPLALAGVAGAAVYLVLLPWQRHWGATNEETRRSLPGDELVTDPGLKITRAVTIDAPVEGVWPWLAQIGQDRAGLYSYAWLENLAGCRMRNADRIHREWQHRDIGETVMLHPLTGIKVARFEPNRILAFEGGWYFVLESIDGHRTRLFARARAPRGLPSVSYALFLELPHFVMERKMLLGLKERAERSSRANRGQPQ